MMIKFFIIGIVCIILGFMSFAYIGVINVQKDPSFFTSQSLTIIGFMLIFIGTASMILFEKQEK
ncbi:MAG: hypothetical protein ACXACC_09210 [Promethearchaeota archaeon]|jgi:uncharacterized membrane protein